MYYLLTQLTQNYLKRPVYYDVWIVRGETAKLAVDPAVDRHHCWPATAWLAAVGEEEGPGGQIRQKRPRK